MNSSSHQQIAPSAVTLLRLIAGDRAAAGLKPAKSIDPKVRAGLPELPEGWLWASIDELVAPEANALTDGPFGSNLKSAHYVSPPEGAGQVVTLGNIGISEFLNDKRFFIDRERFDALCKHHIFPGDLLIAAMAEPVGRCCEVPPDLGPALVKADCYRFRPHPSLDSGYLRHFFNSPPGKRQFESIARGIGRSRINLTNTRTLPVPLPPSTVQASIVEWADAARAHVGAASASLDLIPDLIEKFRQSVLAAAFRGDLTKEWRDQNPDIEPASVLLKRIRAERRERWIEDAAEKGRAKAEAKARKAGKPWADKDDQKVLATERVKAAKKYKEPEPVDPTGLPELPETWCWATVEQLSYSLDYGTSQKSSVDGDVPVLRMGNMQGGEIDWTDLKYTSDAEEIAKYRLEPNTVLFNRTNSPALVGKTAIFRGGREAIHAGYLIRVRHVSSVLPDWLNYSLNSPEGRSWCWLVKTDGVSQSNISASKLATYALPLAPLAEQRNASEQIDALWSSAGRALSQARDATAELERLEQSILAAAFSPSVDE